ncbi:hypothetical protein Pelo_16929 [Pelomyxa schiedti]|nr:hypothetical protein Pelo_16929 [Pelomyxa schiedti]
MKKLTYLKTPTYFCKLLQRLEGEVEVEETTPEAAVSLRVEADTATTAEQTPQNTPQDSSPKAKTKKKKSTWVCTMLAKVNKHAVPILVDTGLAISVISEDTVDRLAQDIQVDNSPNRIIGECKVQL